MFEFKLEIMERERASDNTSLISSSGVGHAETGRVTAQPAPARQDVELPTWIEVLAAH